MKIWYTPHIASQLLRPCSWIYRGAIAVRQAAYRSGLKKVRRFPVPIVVVGNITVGGNGKTPLVIYLANLLTQQGFRPGLVSRGYGGNSRHYPLTVTADCDPRVVGDEAVLLAQRTGCPMVVAPNRPQAVATLLAQTDCDVIISDDGLQHTALGRDIEIVVVDSRRRFGNGLCLPAGPLREPVARLANVDFIVACGNALADEYEMQLAPTWMVNVANPAMKCPVVSFAKERVHAVAGIGNPDRFFQTLNDLSIHSENHPFPDHHRFSLADFQFKDDLPVLMTEKDAVKCQGFAEPHWWYLTVNAALTSGFNEKLLAKLKNRNYNLHN